MRLKHALVVSLAASATVVGSAGAQLTTTSPAGGALPSAVSPVGGIVADLIGLSGNRVVTQLAASTLFRGNSPSTPLMTIGTQGGFNAATITALGGGLAQAAFRVSLFDGDNAPGDFDFNDNFFLVNGAEIGNFSAVTTQRTSGTGTPIGGTTLGFADGELMTGFFFTSNASLLGSIFGGLGGGLLFQLRDTDPGDQFYDFRQGLDASVIDVGSGPIITPGNPNTVIPEPSTVVLLGGGLLGIAGVMRRRARA